MLFKIVALHKFNQILNWLASSLKVGHPWSRQSLNIIFYIIADVYDDVMSYSFKLKICVVNIITFTEN